MLPRRQQAPTWQDSPSRLQGVSAKANAVHQRLKIAAAPAAPTSKKLAQAESPIWTGLSARSGRTKTDGDKLYEWDFTHGDIEVYNARGEHLGTMHPVSGAMIKPAVKGRTIDI